MNTVLRKEKKYLLDLCHAEKVFSRLSKVVHGDSHNGAYGYLIRSLYFDTPDDRDFHEKEDGIELRRKLRLRIYSVSSDFAMLEMKQKNGENQLKRSLKIDRNSAGRLIRGEYEVLLDFREPFALECYGMMRNHCYIPKTVIDYRRSAFTAKENNIRISFDRDVRSSASNYNIFTDELLTIPVMDPSRCILEVKYNGFLLSYIRTLLESVDQSEVSVSKYVLARKMI